MADEFGSLDSHMGANAERLIKSKSLRDRCQSDPGAKIAKIALERNGWDVDKALQAINLGRIAFKVNTVTLKVVSDGELSMKRLLEKVSEIKNVIDVETT